MPRVLVVEDDADIRLALCEMLESEGYEVAEASNGAVALASLTASPDPMVVLLDLHIPDGDGAGFLRAVAADPVLATRHAFLVMSAARATLPQALRRLLAAPLVAKPFDLDDLLAAVGAAAGMLVPAHRPAADE